MDELEKVERLRAKANVSYEEARDALRACDGDLLDAIIYLENLGKTQGPQKGSYSTAYEEQEQYEEVAKKVEEQKKASEKDTSFSGFLKKCWQVLKNNAFAATRKEHEFLRAPLWLCLIVLLFFWRLLIPIIIVSLFFGCRYAFVGKDDLSAANRFFDHVENAADHVKEEFNKKND